MRLIYWSLPIDSATSLFYLRVSGYLAPVAPALFILLARQGAAEMRYQDKWARLEIEE